MERCNDPPAPRRLRCLSLRCRRPLPPQILKSHFEKHGEVIDAFVAYNGRSSRGFGYVTFKEPAGAASAVCGPAVLCSLPQNLSASALCVQVAAMNGCCLGDDDRSREIRVEMARERPAPRPEPRDRSERTPRDDGA